MQLACAIVCSFLKNRVQPRRWHVEIARLLIGHEFRSGSTESSVHITYRSQCRTCHDCNIF